MYLLDQPLSRQFCPLFHNVSSLRHSSQVQVLNTCPEISITPAIHWDDEPLVRLLRRLIPDYSQHGYPKLRQSMSGDVHCVVIVHVYIR